jgi:lipoprotein NlpD
MDHAHALLRGAVAGALALGLAGCGTGFGGWTNSLREAEASAAPDSRGVIDYQTYQVAVAQEGDTLGDIAGRVGGTSGAALGELNGLPGDYRFRQGEMVALPDSVPRGGYGGSYGYDGSGGGTGGVSTGTGWTPQVATTAIDAAPPAFPAETAGTSAAGTGAATGGNPFSNGQSDLVIDPVRHRVEPGETAYSIARLYGVSVTALASWNGLGPDLSVRENQELLIPVVSGANQIQTGDATGTNPPGQPTPMTPPSAAAQPLPGDIVAAVEPASPQLGQYRTPPGGRLAQPVSGPITRDFNPAGTGNNRSDGVLFAVPAGTPVNAAGDGEVALVSESLGGMGTIVLIRHRDDLMTVYGRVGNVTVERGQAVSQGQPIGSVAPGAEPGLHFEVRRGTEAVDPRPYLGS